MLTFYKETPASLLDVFIESTHRRFHEVGSDGLQIYVNLITAQETQGEKYRSTLPQKDLDLHHLSGVFSAMPGDRFAAKYTADVSPYHSIMQEGVDDEAACRSLLNKMVREASRKTALTFFAANDSLHTVQLFNARKRQFLREIAEKTQLEVEWMILPPRNVSDTDAPRAARSLAAKGIAARLWFAKCQQVASLSEEPKEVLVEFLDFGSIQQLTDWRVQLGMRNSERASQEQQDELNRQINLLKESRSD